MADFLKIYEKFKTITAEMRLIGENDAVIAAVSGGRDSTALLLLLKRLASEKKDLYVAAFHFNHCLRGAESDGDEAFVKKLSEDWKIDFYSERGDVKGYAEKNKLSLETAARDLRYGALNRCAEKIRGATGKNVKIAVAHTAEDRAETVFLNIVRGTSTEGLEGIKYVNANVIRPLLDLKKDDVETVCKEFGSGYRTDSTNFMRIGKRNVARLDVFPYINGKMNCDITERLLSLSKLAAADADFISKEADKAFEKGVKVIGGDVELFPEILKELHPSVRSRIVRKAISLAEKDGERPYRDCVSVTADMVERTAGFINGGSGVLELGKGVYCTGSAGRYVITCNKPAERNEGMPEIQVTVPEYGQSFTVKTEDGGELRVSVIGGADIEKAVREASESGESIAVFDAEELRKMISETGLKLRCPREGDRIRPFGTGGGKSLGKFLTDKKIRGSERGKIRLLAAGNNVIHVFGVRRSDSAPVTESTRSCAVFELKLP